MKNIISLFLLLISGYCFSQIKTGQWRVHSSYQDAKTLTKAGDLVYCSSGSGLFSYDQTDNSTQIYSKTNLLNDVEIVAINYDNTTKSLVVAYENTNIDIIQNGVVTNLPQIKRKLGIPVKKINSISFHNKIAYISCSFGIVAVDLEKREIKDTYLIGENGSYVNVNNIFVFGDSIYAAATNGVYQAFLNSNLINYANWTLINLPTSNTYTQVCSLNNDLYIAYKKNNEEYCNLYKKTSNSYETVNLNTSRLIALKQDKDNMWIIEPSRVRLIDSNLKTIRDINKELGFSDAIKDVQLLDNGNIIIANSKDGFLEIDANNSISNITPNGPVSPSAFSMNVLNQKLYVASGGITDTWNNLYRSPKYYTYENETWKSIERQNTYDFTTILPNPQKPEDIYIATYGRGVWLFENDKLKKVYNRSNSPLQSALQFKDQPNDTNYVRTYGLAFDKDNNLWVSNCEVPNAINVLKPDGTWVALPYGNILSSEDTNVGQIIITQSNVKWIQLPRKTSEGGLFVLDENGTLEKTSDDKYKVVKMLDQKGAEIERANEVHCLAEDKNGAIWVGTANGPVVFYNPDNFYDGENFYAQRCITILKGDTAYLLENQIVTSIVVDGANRKWLGTMNSGVFLMSEDGSQQILNFNTNNSPLLSNQINSIAIDHKSGEVFFGTEKGIISYRSDATNGEEQFGNVYAFPNPVKPDYTGVITITGLLSETIVKITDITGNLVYECTSNGGTATWDGKTFTGKKVSTGVYLIFCSTKDGVEAIVSKLLFVN